MVSGAYDKSRQNDGGGRATLRRSRLRCRLQSRFGVNQSYFGQNYKEKGLFTFSINATLLKALSLTIGLKNLPRKAKRR